NDSVVEALLNNPDRGLTCPSPPGYDEHLPVSDHRLLIRRPVMNSRSRREFLEDVGRGMLVASLGSVAAFDLGVSPAIAEEASQRLTFGNLESLVSLMQESPPAKLLPLLVAKLQAGIPLKTLVSSAALANARAFGGNDYTGYHTFMALVPAYKMAGEL